MLHILLAVQFLTAAISLTITSTFVSHGDDIFFGYSSRVFRKRMRSQALVFGFEISLSRKQLNIAVEIIL